LAPTDEPPARTMEYYGHHWIYWAHGCKPWEHTGDEFLRIWSGGRQYKLFPDFQKKIPFQAKNSYFLGEGLV